MDPISDMLIRVKNAQKAGHETVLVSYSKFKHEIANALEKNGFLQKIEKRGRKTKRFLELVLWPKENSKTVNEIKLLSRPSRRLYIGHKELGRMRSGEGTIILSTSKGVMASHEAYKLKLGGQLIAEIT